MSKEDKVERLENLLSKSIAYSEFLANKLKDGEDVKDGKVTGKKLSQPKLIQGEMRPYQLIGVHWLVGLYENGLNGILGDEMGLGKTVQSIAMLAHLSGQGVSGPFMVVGPLSTLYNWMNEFKKWAPKMDAVIYHGGKKEREDLRNKHWRGKQGGKGGGDMPVMITSYEIVIRDIAQLRKIMWKFLIIDEGHRLKNMNCRLIRELKSITENTVCNRLLLTGTPLQNNLTELWSLLNFLLPSIFDDLDSFQTWFEFDFSKEDTEAKVMEGEMQNQVVTKLHQILRPFLLRRLKQDVEIGLPKKYEYILFAWMTDWQSQMYQDLKKKALQVRHQQHQHERSATPPSPRPPPPPPPPNLPSTTGLGRQADALKQRPDAATKVLQPSVPLRVAGRRRGQRGRRRDPLRGVGQDAAARPHPNAAQEGGRPPELNLLPDDAYARHLRGLPYLEGLVVPALRRHRRRGRPFNRHERVPGQGQ